MRATYSVDSIEIFGQGVFQAESVVVDKEGNVYGGGRDGVIYKVSPEGAVTEIATIPGSMPNGITMDRQGNFVLSDCGKKAVVRVTLSGQVSMIADRVDTVALTLPNVACYDADGNLYVSNTSTRDISSVVVEVAKPEPNGALVCIRPDGKGEVVATGIYLANGVAIDPEEEAVYVLESSRKDCLRIALKKDGTFGKPEIYAKDFPGLPDGMAFDAEGNLYVTIPAAIKDVETSNAEQIIDSTFDPWEKHVKLLDQTGIVGANQIIRVDTNGNWTLFVEDQAGEKLAWPTNCAFGGAGLTDLYIANLRGNHLSRIHTSVRGHPLYHQR
ncbi:MAG: SMP-30/gluconolactonase/LRE family protein [Acidobacteria bacterium]|nr:SMP-30/gluconolactonase/LRE family protein [Acidobacteriota bacterium]